jgi:hypothetical protein
MEEAVKAKASIYLAAALCVVMACGSYFVFSRASASRQGETRNGDTGQVYRTAADAEAALRTNPDDMVAHRALGMLFYVTTDRRKAIYHLREAIRIAQRIDPGDAVAPLCLGRLLLQVGETAEGTSILQRLDHRNDAIGRAAREALQKHGK